MTRRRSDSLSSSSSSLNSEYAETVARGGGNDDAERRHQQQQQQIRRRKPRGTVFMVSSAPEAILIAGYPCYLKKVELLNGDEVYLYGMPEAGPSAFEQITQPPTSSDPASESGPDMLADEIWGSTKLYFITVVNTELLNRRRGGDRARLDRKKQQHYYGGDDDDDGDEEVEAQVCETIALPQERMELVFGGDSCMLAAFMCWPVISHSILVTAFGFNGEYTEPPEPLKPRDMRRLGSRIRATCVSCRAKILKHSNPAKRTKVYAPDTVMIDGERVMLCYCSRECAWDDQDNALFPTGTRWRRKHRKSTQTTVAIATAGPTTTTTKPCGPHGTCSCTCAACSHCTGQRKRARKRTTGDTQVGKRRSSSRSRQKDRKKRSEPPKRSSKRHNDEETRFIW